MIEVVVRDQRQDGLVIRRARRQRQTFHVIDLIFQIRFDQCLAVHCPAGEQSVRRKPANAHLYAFEPAEAPLQQKQRAIFKAGDVGQIKVADVGDVKRFPTTRRLYPARVIAALVIKLFR